MFIRYSTLLLLLCCATFAKAQQDHITLTAQTVAVGTTQDYEANKTITNPSGTAFVVEGESTLKAGEEILLEDGFEAVDGAEFCATVEIPSAFASLKTELNTSFYRCRQGTLKFKYTEDFEHDAEALDAQVYNNANQLVQTLSLTKSTGINTYTVDLQGTSLYTDQAYYVLKVTDLKRRTYYLRFRYEQN